VTDRLLIGRVTKAHGLRGEVVVDLLSSEPEVRLAPRSVLDTDRGPLTVVASRPHQGKWLVTFTGVSSREQADALRGRELFGEPLQDPDALWVHDLVGAEVVDSARVARGRVVAVLANPADDLLELDGGALVPVGFIIGRDDNGRIVVDVPEGLFDL
jgi:16S rRNA processing protein RimM